VRHAKTTRLPLEFKKERQVLSFEPAINGRSLVNLIEQQHQSYCVPDFLAFCTHDFIMA
jgi:hypothetical protein